LNFIFLYFFVEQDSMRKKIFLLTCWFVIYLYICTPKTALIFNEQKRLFLQNKQEEDLIYK